MQLAFGARTEKIESVVVPKDGTPDSAMPPDAAAGADSTAGERPTEVANTTAVLKGHGRIGAAPYQGAERIDVPHSSLRAGDACPACGEGTVYDKVPGVLAGAWTVAHRFPRRMAMKRSAVVILRSLAAQVAIALIVFGPPFVFKFGDVIELKDPAVVYFDGPLYHETAAERASAEPVITAEEVNTVPALRLLAGNKLRVIVRETDGLQAQIVPALRPDPEISTKRNEPTHINYLRLHNREGSTFRDATR